MKLIEQIKLHSILIILFSILLTFCGKEEVPKSSLVVRDNLLYKKGSDIPFTGREKALINNKIVEYDVKDGFKHGEFKIFSENGNIEMQGQLDSNRNVGYWQYFYPDGKIESEGNFTLDEPDGKWIWNYPDGKRKEEGEYKNGVRLGLWYQYDENGKIIFEHNYETDDANKDSTST